MIYTFNKHAGGGSIITGRVDTWDEYVVGASETWKWAIGKHIVIVLQWARSKGFKWEASA